jgi:hypothetical protein
MKPHAATPQITLGPLPKPVKNSSISTAKKLPKAVPPPDEETLKRLNAIVKEYPFCIYYKEKNNDPL